MSEFDRSEWLRARLAEVEESERAALAVLEQRLTVLRSLPQPEVDLDALWAAVERRIVANAD